MEKATILEWSIEEATRAIAEGDITAEAYAETLLAQASRCAHLNAFIALEPDTVRTAARRADQARSKGAVLGPLHGVPIGIKDSIGTADYPTTAGTPALRGNRPQQDAAVVARLRAAGAIVFGKTNLHELCYGVTSNNAGFGAVRNPHDPARVPGGSSGGTAAAVAARIVPGGLGTDTGASVRLPMAFCGGVGLRPTHGRWSIDGLVPASHTRDTPGPMARRTGDCALLDAIVTGDRADTAAPELKGLRLGLPRALFWSDLDPGIERVLDGVLARLREEGVVLVEEGELAGIDELAMHAGSVIAAYENVVDLEDYLREHMPGLDLASLVTEIASPDVKGIMQAVTAPPGIAERDYRHALEVERPALRERYARYFASARVDALLMPTCPLATPRIGEDRYVSHNGREVPLLMTAIRNTNPGSVAGIPGLSLYAGSTEAGMPVGLALDAPLASDRRLLAIGRALEAILPPVPRPPGLGL